jgi:hypothetical protein
MKRKQSIDALLDKALTTFNEVELLYKKSLNEQAIDARLKIDIKNIFENLRSCLDYLALEIIEKYLPAQSAKIYFPVTSTKSDFESRVNKYFPNLINLCPEVYQLLDQIQPYNDPWLGKFNKLNNDNKHQDLVEQIKSTERRVDVRDASGGGVSWTSGITFGAGVSVMGVPIDTKTQLPIANSIVKTTVTTWIDFKFQNTGDSVLSFITESRKRVIKLVNDLSSFL